MSTGHVFQQEIVIYGPHMQKRFFLNSPPTVDARVGFLTPYDCSTGEKVRFCFYIFLVAPALVVFVPYLCPQVFVLEICFLLPCSLNSEEFWSVMERALAE